ncbi:MAG: hypothetical protein JOZ88_17025 [Hyphomicrobiales bacterium]|nr:hypothetical protein [Hyphomicrobiales bacterium]
MIIELFGPPAVGKTTFADAMRNRLQKSGRDAELVLSFRPAEPASFASHAGKWAIGRRAAVLRRLLRPMVEFGAMAGNPVAFFKDVRFAWKLVGILPPRSPMYFLRYIQYLSRMSHYWRRAVSGRNIVLFDQAFVQAVCSLILLSQKHDQGRIERALELIPTPDLLIRLDAPRNVLEARLGDREHGQSGAERLFELDLGRNLETAEIIHRVDELLRTRGRAVALFSSVDRDALDEAVELTAAKFEPL